VAEETLPEMPEVSAWESMGEARREQIRRRFLRRVVRIDSGCEIWTGAVSSPDGYGRMMITTEGVAKTYSAHRLACLLAGITMTRGRVVDHQCNEPLCVRVHPEHVRVSTQAENLAYAAACGRAIGPRVSVDSARRADRSRAVRSLALSGWSARAYDELVAEYETGRDDVLDDQGWLF
jgi:hypothetical protein